MRLLRKFRPPVQKWTTTVEGACLRPRPPVPPHARSGWSRCFLTPTVWTSLSLRGSISSPPLDQAPSHLPALAIPLAATTAHH